MDAAVTAAGWFIHIAIDKYFDRKLEQWASRAGVLDDFRHLKNQSSMARATLTVVDWRQSLPNDALLILIRELQLAAIDVDHVLGEMDCCRLTELVGSTGGALRTALLRSVDLFINPFKRAKTSAAGGMEGLAGHGAVVVPPFVLLHLEKISARAKSVSARLEDAATMVRKIVKLEQSVLTSRLLLHLEEVSLCQACSSLADPKVLLGRDEDASNNSINPNPRSRAVGSLKAGAKRKRARQQGCTIPEVMELVCRAGAEIGSDEHFVATQLFVKLEFREMFLTLKAPEHRIAWLKRMWNERKGAQ